ncbi:Lipoma hmgic fusion partner protein [Fasciola hepatica]|uniref:Lipoma hmgic fusion partner protein n=1 Tax=Fasciola hepatica TaxID=6192 RepID=A0A4E0RNL0_FASHE|nr:Lipoma hmgic fusion partner protein [Fasciola hepatica]
MPRVILSWIALLWISLSCASTVIILTGLFTSAWLRRVETVESRRFTECPSNIYPSLIFPIYPELSEKVISTDSKASDSPSIGPWFRCQLACTTARNVWPFTWSTSTNQMMRCQLALRGFGDRPAQANALTWTSAVLYLTGSVLLCISTIMVLFTICKRNICDRSMHSFTGAIQGLSDILLVAGLIIWPIGWDSVTIREVCGGSVGPYAKGNCSLGWGPVAVGVGVLLLFISSLLAGAADKSLSTHAATRQMLLDGKTCVFLH